MSATVHATPSANRRPKAPRTRCVMDASSTWKCAWTTERTEDDDTASPHICLVRYGDQFGQLLWNLTAPDTFVKPRMPRVTRTCCRPRRLIRSGGAANMTPIWGARKPPHSGGVRPATGLFAAPAGFIHARFPRETSFYLLPFPKTAGNIPPAPPNTPLPGSTP